MLHYDADNILHCLITGRKDWIFIHPFNKFRSDMASNDPGQVYLCIAIYQKSQKIFFIRNAVEVNFDLFFKILQAIIWSKHCNFLKHVFCL